MRGLLAILAAAFVLGMTTSALAQDRFYISAGYDYFSDGLNGGDVNFGWQINRYYALQGGLTIGVMRVDYYGDSIALAVAEGTADIYGFLPLGRRGGVSLFGTAGIASIGVAARDSYGNEISKSGAGARVGGGIDLRLSRVVHLRATGRYQYMSVADLIGSDTTASMQTVFYF